MSETFGFRESVCVYRWKRDGARERVLMCVEGRESERVSEGGREGEAK